ncbi:MAG: glycerate 2-kinase [Chloroflexota bacterium]|nr:glycerate 2-kinase [Chloroflexota bacterium]
MADAGRRDAPLTILIAPDSFKGSLSSVTVAAAIATGWSRARPNDRIEVAPLADGGEGLLDAIEAAGGWDALPAHAEDPIGRPIEGRFLRQGDRAVVELATASGISRLARDERDALMASTFGTGQILATAIGLGCRDVVLGLGGSATTDGGSGLLRALGAQFLDERGKELAPGGGPLGRLAKVDVSGLSSLLREVTLTIASDVTNPLTGEHGAAAVYGPQKGADEAAVRFLDANLDHYAAMLQHATGRNVRDEPGSGAAGGTTAGLLAIADAFAELRIRPGIEVVMEITDFPARVADADVVITGEGRIDEQTAFGKTALGVARRAAEAGKACLAFGGGVTEAGAEALLSLGAVAVPVTERPMSVDEAMTAGPGPVERAAERVARVVSMARA